MWSMFFNTVPSEFTKSKTVVMPSRILLDCRRSYFQVEHVALCWTWRSQLLYILLLDISQTRTAVSIKPFFLAFLIHAKWQLFAQGLSRLYCFTGRVSLHSRRNWHEIDAKLTVPLESRRARVTEDKFHKLTLKVARTKHKEISLMGSIIYNELYHH